MKIIKYNEFFDSETLKQSHEIEVMSKTLTKSSIIRNFNEQSPFQPVFGQLIYKFKFLSEAAKPSPYSFLAESKTKPIMYFINFKNEQTKLTIGITILENKKYDLHLIYIPEGIDMENQSNWMNVMGELIGIRRNIIVDQEFNNLDINGVIRKIDKVMIPIMKEFGFDALLSTYKSDYDIERN